MFALKVLWRRSMITAVALVWISGPGMAFGEGQHQAAEAVAKKVERQAERSEKKEGKQDLIKDSVKTDINEDGKKVIEQVGEASFYGKWHHGKETANGEKFNQNAKTAAHPTLPMGTEATVTNLESGESVQVEINDRGPYVKGRDIDLSKGAAREIGITREEGVAPVKIEAIIPTEKK